MSVWDTVVLEEPWSRLRLRVVLGDELARVLGQSVNFTPLGRLASALVSRMRPDVAPLPALSAGGMA